MEIITFIIAIIGAITGVLGLLIQFIEYLKSKVKLKMKIDERRTFYNINDNKNKPIYKCTVKKSKFYFIY